MRNKSSFFMVILLGLAALCGLGNGCATTGHTRQNSVGYHYYDMEGEYRLIGKNDDVWLQKTDGSESRQITHTPNIVERDAAITKDLRFIVYREFYKNGGFQDFRVNLNSNDINGQKTPIDCTEAYYIGYGKNKK